MARAEVPFCQTEKQQKDQICHDQTLRIILEEDTRTVHAHCCRLVGLSAVLQQQRHDVCVSLLGSLVQRSVAELQERRRPPW